MVRQMPAALRALVDYPGLEWEEARGRLRYDTSERLPEIKYRATHEGEYGNAVPALSELAEGEALRRQLLADLKYLEHPPLFVGIVLDAFAGAAREGNDARLVKLVDQLDGPATAKRRASRCEDRSVNLEPERNLQ